MERIARANRLIKTSRIIILVGFGLVAAAALAVFIGLFRSRNADMWVLHTLDVQQTAQALLIASRDAESSVRSYLLSSDSAELDTFEPALSDTATHLGDLRTLTADNSIELDRVQELTRLIHSKNEQLSTCVTLAKQGQRDAALAVINSPQDRQLLDEIRTNVESILDTEQILLKDRQNSGCSAALFACGFGRHGPACRHHPCQRPGGLYAQCPERPAFAHRRARPRIEASSGGRIDAAPGAENGGRGPAYRRRRARLQQSPHRHHGQSRYAAAPACCGGEYRRCSHPGRQDDQAARVRRCRAQKARRNSRRGCLPSLAVRRWSPAVSTPTGWFQACSTC